MGGMMDMFGSTDDSGLMEAATDAKKQYEGIQPPNLHWNTYAPDAYSAQLSKAQTVGDDPLVRSAQMSALAKMGDLANTGLSDVDQQGYENARQLGNQMASSGSQAAMQNAQARGLAGSGMEFANREIANQQGAQRAQQAGLQQASDSARQRALYNQAYSNALGGMQSQETGRNAQNAGILNQFNMANTNANNQANLYNTNAQNQAKLQNQQGYNGAQQQNFNNQITKAGGIAGGDQIAANAYAAKNASDTSQQNNMMNMGLSAAALMMMA